MKQHLVLTDHPSLLYFSLFLSLSLSPFLAHSFFFIRSLNVANKNNTIDVARGCTGVAANYKNNTANRSNNRSISRAPLTLTSLTFCRLELWKVWNLALFYFPSLSSLSLSLSHSLSFSHPSFSRSHGCTDTNDDVWWHVCLIGSRARTSLFFFKLHDDYVFLLWVFTYINRVPDSFR